MASEPVEQPHEHGHASPHAANLPRPNPRDTLHPPQIHEEPYGEPGGEALPDDGPRATPENAVPEPPRDPEVQRLEFEAEALPLMDLIYSVARRMVGDEARAEDLVQETYLRAFRSSEQYRTGTNCKAWLLKILRSVYIDASRHVQARGGSHEQLPHDIHAAEEKAEVPMNPQAFMNVLDLMVDDDVRGALLSLPELYREAFVMVVIAELPYKEAAAVLGVQEGTVKSRVFRACQSLKSRLWSYATERRLRIKQNPLS